MRRFIAGAKCPQCEAIDKIYITLEDGEDVARCTACDYRSVRPKDEDPVVHPDDEAEQLKKNSDVGVIKIMPRKS